MVTTPASGDPVTQVATRDSSNNSPEVGEMPKIFGLTKRNKTYYYRSRIYDFFSIFFPPAKDGTCRKEYVRSLKTGDYNKAVADLSIGIEI
jgi:hypothetical protein